MRKIAVIVAGGSGTRMRTATPKQFLPLQGKPVLWHSVSAFLDAYDDLSIILVASTDYLGKTSEIITMFAQPERIRLAEGGPTRFQSVKNGLQQVNEQAIVFIHDAVRCLVTKELIVRCYSEALVHGTAVPAVPSPDSIRIGTTENNEVYDRSRVNIVQTPQTFSSEIVLRAYQQEFDDSFTDDATVVEKSGVRIHLVQGEDTNIKITRPIDMVIAEAILERKP